MRRRALTIGLFAATCLVAAAAAQSRTATFGRRIDPRRREPRTGYTKGVTVAIIDTAIDDGNPDLAGSVVAEHCFVPPDGCPNGAAEQDGSNSAQDDEGHGTAISDIISGDGNVGPIGVAPDASLVVVKVADHNGRTTGPQIVAGLNWVREHHPEARIVNVSLGSDVLLSGACDGLSSTLVAYGDAINALRAQGSLVFASSGDGGFKYSMSAPACIQATVAVGAVYSRSFGSVRRRSSAATRRPQPTRSRVSPTAGRSSTCWPQAHPSRRRSSAQRIRRSRGHPRRRRRRLLPLPFCFRPIRRSPPMASRRCSKRPESRSST